MNESLVKQRGIIFVISAPSGAGKTTVSNLLLKRLDNLSMSVSHTTRKMRPGEICGVHYHFVDEKTFIAMAKKGEFLEWASVHGNLYGTALENIEKSVGSGGDLLLDIDTQGADTLREKGMDCLTILLLPPSMEELERRLKFRGDESDESIKVRLENAVNEMAQREKYDYEVVNDKIEGTVGEIMQIIETARAKR